MSDVDLGIKTRTAEGL